MEMEFVEEYKKFLEEKEHLFTLTTVGMKYDGRTIENNINLYRMRHNLKSLIFNLGSNSETQIVDSHDEITFLKEYREFLTEKRQQFPQFIFDDFDAEKFGKCVEYKYAGHSLVETEEYYIYKIKNQKRV